LIRDTKVINLSSQSSSGVLLNGDKKSKVAYELKNFIDFEGDNSVEYVSVSMPYVVLCNSCYIINSSNNVLKYSYDTGTPDYGQYEFPHGNYNVNTFIAQWNYLTASIGSPRLTFNNLTQKFTVESMGFGAQIQFLEGSTIDYILGFSGSTPVLLQAEPYTFPRCANFLPLPRFNIVCDWLSNGALLTNSGTEFSTSTIMASVPNNSKNNNLIVYESTENEFILKNPTINNITISIMDDRGNYVDFNGISSYFSLRFNVFRRRLPKLLPFSKIVDYATTLIPVDAQELEYS
jgi:hypothetical protein